MEKSKVSVTLKNLLFVYIVTGVLLVILALALYKFKLKEGQIQMGVNGIYVLSCFLGGILMGKSLKRKRFFWGLLIGVLYFVVLMGVSMMLNRGLNGDWRQIGVALGICAGSGTIGGMVS